MEIELNNWNIKEFTSMSQDSPATGATTDPSLFSPGAKGASWFGQGNGSGGGTASGDSETLYDLQGLVSHSGTLHGVRLKLSARSCSLFCCYMFCNVMCLCFL